MDDYLTVKQVAAAANAGVATVYRWIYDGSLPWINISGGKKKARIRVRRSAFDAFMGARERSAA